MDKERKEKLWQPFHEEALVQTQQKLNDFENKKKNQSNEETNNDSGDKDPVSSIYTFSNS